MMYVAEAIALLEEASCKNKHWMSKTSQLVDGLPPETRGNSTSLRVVSGKAEDMSLQATTWKQVVDRILDCI